MLSQCNKINSSLSLCSKTNNFLRICNKTSRILNLFNKASKMLSLRNKTNNLLNKVNNFLSLRNQTNNLLSFRNKTNNLLSLYNKTRFNIVLHKLSKINKTFSRTPINLKPNSHIHRIIYFKDKLLLLNLLNHSRPYFKIQSASKITQLNLQIKVIMKHKEAILKTKYKMHLLGKISLKHKPLRIRHLIKCKIGKQQFNK